MKLVDVLTKAKAEKFAVGAFNIGGLDTLKAVAEAAGNLGAPVIVEVSPGEQRYLGLQNFSSLVSNTKEEYGGEIFLNLDHGADMEIIKTAIELGFDMVHFDGSSLPLEENIRLCQEVVAAAHGKGVLVEGEMDPIGQRLTDPQAARSFTEKTGVDILAVSVGNKHGMEGEEKLDLERLREINTALPESFFSLHGGSGVAPEDLAAAIPLGIVKINVNTELRLAYRETLENVLRGDPEEIAMYKLLPPVIEAVEKVVEAKILMFGSAGVRA
jgi:fructose-bisphosphate aldolase class II